jgi:hypothetical protein
VNLQTCRRHPDRLFALSCPGCRQDIHDKQYPAYATRPRPAAVRQPVTLDPSAAHLLQVITNLRPAIAKRETALDQRGWRQDDISASLIWQVERDRQAVHIAEEQLLDLYGAPRRTTPAA